MPPTSHRQTYSGMSRANVQSNIDRCQLFAKPRGQRVSPNCRAQRRKQVRSSTAKEVPGVMYDTPRTVVIDLLVNIHSNIQKLHRAASKRRPAPFTPAETTSLRDPFCFAQGSSIIYLRIDGWISTQVIWMCSAFLWSCLFLLLYF
jgi:hypothetical protein